MNHKQVTINPQDIDDTIRQLSHFFQLDDLTLATIRRIIADYPEPISLYVDDSTAALLALSPLDDHFTFNSETGALVLFTTDVQTFLNALVEMQMYMAGFQTRMEDDDHWKVEFAIGAWKPIKNTIKARLGIHVDESVQGTVGLPPEEVDLRLDDPHPFKTLVSTLNIISYTQMVRLAGRPDIHVHFPAGTDPRVMEVYLTVKRKIQQIGEGLDIEDVDQFNDRLETAIAALEAQYQPDDLPLPANWRNLFGDAPPGLTDTNPDEATTRQLLLGSPKDEPDMDQLPADAADPGDNTRDQRLAEGPFGAFIDTLFDD
ncbi:MAG: hypothetical protein ACLFTK_03960 [Anaerolineales bacterium]